MSVHELNLLPACFIERKEVKKKISSWMLGFIVISLCVVASFFIIEQAKVSQRVRLDSINNKKQELAARMELYNQLVSKKIELARVESAFTAIYKKQSLTQLLSMISKVAPDKLWLAEVTVLSAVVIGGTQGAVTSGNTTNQGYYRIANSSAVDGAGGHTENIKVVMKGGAPTEREVVTFMDGLKTVSGLTGQKLSYVNEVRDGKKRRVEFEVGAFIR